MCTTPKKSDKKKWSSTNVIYKQTSALGREKVYNKKKKLREGSISVIPSLIAPCSLVKQRAR